MPAARPAAAPSVLIAPIGGVSNESDTPDTPNAPAIASDLASAEPTGEPFCRSQYSQRNKHRHPQYRSIHAGARFEHGEREPDT